MDLLRQPNESAYDHHKRLIYGKLEDKTLADIDYSELSELVYGQEYSSDVARRMMYGSRNTIKIMEEERVNETIRSGDDILKELEDKRKELQKEKQKFADQRREYNKLLNKDGRFEHITDCLRESAERLNETASLNERTKIDIPGDNEAVLVLNDWHYGMVTDNIWNHYDTDVCKKRVANVVNEAIERIVMHKCKKLHIMLLGDMIHGAIHVSARVASEENVCDQLMQVSEILARAIHRLSMSVEETTVYCTFGNHARTIQNKNDSVHADNMEKIIPWWLEQRFINNDSVTIHCGYYEFIFADVCDFEFCASHGDLDTVKSSPKVLNALSTKLFGRDLDYILLGDKHHRESFSEFGIDAIICEALCGVDDYANDKRLYSDPKQLLLIVKPMYGVDAEYHIRCDGVLLQNEDIWN